MVTIIRGAILYFISNISSFNSEILPRLLPFITLLFAISGYIIYAITSKDHPQAGFYLLPCRYWEIIVDNSTFC